MSEILMILGYAFIFLGLIMIIFAIIGCNRLPDYFSKMHAASLGDSVGCTLVLIGIALQSYNLIMAGKIIILALILLIINPTSSYILNQIALKLNLPLDKRDS